MSAPTISLDGPEGPSSPILGFFRDQDSRAFIASAFDRPGLGELMLSEGGIDVALKVMRRGEKPCLVVYDISGSTNAVSDIQLLAKHGGRALPIIAIGGGIDTARFREYLAAGMFDYLDCSLGAPALADAITRARRQRTRRATDQGPARSGKVAVFCGTRGGVGTTSCAIATAWTLAHDRGENTVLLDLDLVLGTTAFALDIDPGRGLREGLEQPGRIDAVFVERSLVRESAKLAVLSAEEPFEHGTEIDPAAAIVLIEELRQSFDRIVVDLPRNASALNRAVLSAADDIILVTNATFAGLRDVIRWTDFIATIADKAVVRIVQGPAPGGTSLPLAEFEKSLGRKIDLVLPFDAKGAAAAANAGRAIPAAVPASPMTKAIADLTVLLGYEPTVTPPRGPVRWFKRTRDAHP